MACEVWAGLDAALRAGRPHRCGWSSLPALRYAARINVPDELVVTKLGVLDSFEEIRALTTYERDGQPVAGFPAAANDLARCRPVWRSFRGWRCPTTSARYWLDLPAEVRAHLEWVEHECGVPIAVVSVGAERKAEVRRS